LCLPLFSNPKFLEHNPHPPILGDMFSIVCVCVCGEGGGLGGWVLLYIGIFLLCKTGEASFDVCPIE